MGGAIRQQSWTPLWAAHPVLTHPLVHVCVLPCAYMGQVYSRSQWVGWLVGACVMGGGQRGVGRDTSPFSRKGLNLQCDSVSLWGM